MLKDSQTVSVIALDFDGFPKCELHNENISLKRML